MGQSIINWAWSQTVGFPEIKLVLVIMAMDANSEGRGNIALAELARSTDIEERKIPGILHSLENFGLAYANVDADGVIRYRLCLDKPGKPGTWRR